MFEHFYELSEMERGLVDLREYKVTAEEKPVEGVELQKAKTVPGPRKAPKRAAPGLKAVYERALPKIFRDEKLPEYQRSKIDAQLQELNAAVEEFGEISKRAAYPINLGCRRSSCCCFYKSLFHEVKQMGIVLRRAFKGTHVWIPPISK